MASETLQELLARGSAIRRQARALAEAGKPVRFIGRNGRAQLVSPDLDTPGEWRVTSFDGDGQPWGHYCTRAAYDAFREVLTGGAVPFHREVAR
jgi:hypothetical protein